MLIRRESGVEKEWLGDWCELDEMRGINVVTHRRRIDSN